MWRSRSTCIEVELICETRVRMALEATEVIARSTKRPRIARPTQGSRLLPPGAKTRSKSGWISQESAPSVEPSITLSRKAMLIVPVWRLR